MYVCMWRELTQLPNLTKIFYFRDVIIIALKKT